jgi:hypothetical protein
MDTNKEITAQKETAMLKTLQRNRAAQPAAHILHPVRLTRG